MRNSFRLLKKPNIRFSDLFNASNFIVLRERPDYSPFPLPYYFTDYVTSRAKKLYGANLTFAIEASFGAFHTGVSRNIFGSAKDVDYLRQQIVATVEKRPSSVQQQRNKSLHIAKKFRHFLQELLMMNVAQLSNAQLIRLHTQWITYYSDYSLMEIMMYFVAGDSLVRRLFERLDDYQIPEEEKILLSTPFMPSYTFREELSLLNIARGVNYSATYRKQPQNIQRLLVQHAKQWGWLPFEYIGPTVWSAEDMFHRLQKEVHCRAEAERKIHEKTTYDIFLQKRQRQIAATYRIKGDLLKFSNAVRLVTTMQDEKKEICTYAQYALHKVLFKSFSEKIGIQPVECIKFHHEELWQGLKDPQTLKKLLPKRLQAVCVVGTKDGMYIYSSQKAKKIYNAFNPKLQRGNLSGQIACRGKVAGVAKVLRSPLDIGKMNRGDILVARMTTPDYVVGMKKAAAIVTDEGGLTCHAAIVSRELHVPCIIGTKIATKVLKDGDLVEVDAEKGIVRKLS